MFSQIASKGKKYLEKSKYITGKWVWSGCILWNSQIISKKYYVVRKKDFQVSPDIFSFFQESEISTEWTSSSRKTSCGFISTEVVVSIYRGGNEIRIWGAPRDRHDRVWALIARLPVVSPQIKHSSCCHAWLAIMCQVFPSVAWSRWSNVFFFRPDFTWGSQQA